MFFHHIFIFLSHRDGHLSWFLQQQTIVPPSGPSHSSSNSFSQVFGFITLFVLKSRYLTNRDISQPVPLAHQPVPLVHQPVPLAHQPVPLVSAIIQRASIMISMLYAIEMNTDPSLSPPNLKCCMLHSRYECKRCAS